MVRYPSPNDVVRTVLRCIVEDDQLEVPIRPGDNAVQALLDIPIVVVRPDDHGYQGLIFEAVGDPSQPILQDVRYGELLFIGKSLTGQTCAISQRHSFVLNSRMTAIR